MASGILDLPIRNGLGLSYSNIHVLTKMSAFEE